MRCLWLGWGHVRRLGRLDHRLIPAVGGLLVGLLWRRFVGEERYHGVAASSKPRRWRAVAWSEVMKTAMTVLHEADTLAAAAELFTAHASSWISCRHPEGHLIGVFGVQDLERVQTQNGGVEVTVAAGMSPRCPANLSGREHRRGAARMSLRDVGRLPVVARDEQRNCSACCGVRPGACL